MVKDYCDKLPYHLHQDYDTVLTALLGNKDGSIPRAHHCQLPCLKRQLNHLQRNPPPGRVRLLICPLQLKPDFKVLRLHPQPPPHNRSGKTRFTDHSISSLDGDQSVFLPLLLLLAAPGQTSGCP